MRFHALALSILLTILAASAAVAALPSGWSTQSNPAGGTLYDIEAIAANTAFAVGSNGTILKTIDGGQTWTKLTSGTTATLTSVCFLDANNGWAAGGTTVVRTTDGGSTWTPYSITPANDIKAIAFASTTVGVAVGYVGSQGFARSTDGGETWTAIDAGNSGSNRPQNVQFVNATQGWAVGMNADFITTTCEWGSCWTNYSNPKSRVWRTADGGATWTTFALGSTAWVRGVSFIDASNGWIAGDSGKIWQTTNGGDSWSLQTSGVTVALYGIDFADSQNGWAVGNNGTILATTNGGATWTAQTTGVTTALNSVGFGSTSAGWAVGTVILRSENGGSCGLLLNPASMSVSPAGETGKSITLTTDAGCAWTALSNDSFVTVTSAPSGSGSGTVTFDAAANGGASRQGTISIGSRTFPVVQIGEADQLNFVTLAGGSQAGYFMTYGSTDATGSAARFYGPSGVAVDGSGNIFVADSSNYTIRKITSTGVVTRIAGWPGSSGSTDATGSNARFLFPRGVAVDGAGNVYVADADNDTIRMIAAGNVVTTLAGLAGNSGTTDGTGSTARFNSPRSLAVDPTTGNLYIADTNNHAIRMVTTGGVVTTFAGLPGTSGSADGTAGAARFNSPGAIAIDSTGNLYVADSGNNTIRVITPSAVVTTLAGQAGSSGTADGTGTAARFDYPRGIAVDSSGNVYVTNYSSHTLRKITGSEVTTLAGAAGKWGSVDGTGDTARFNYPRGLAVDSAGNIYVADADNNSIRKVTPAGVVTTLAGCTSPWYAEGTGSAARFNYPRGVAADSTGNVYVADSANHTIRKVTSAGAVTTLAGSAENSGTSDGNGSVVRFNEPRGVAVDAASGNIYVADYANHTIRQITPAGVVTTIAGTAGSPGADEGAGIAAKFRNPSGVAVGSGSTIFVADTGNHTIRKITMPDAVVTTFAGTAGAPGTADGNGIGAQFNGPAALAVDGSGTLFVADRDNHTIRSITAAGVVTTLAGGAGVPGSDNGIGTSARFKSPAAIAVAGGGRILVGDTGNDTVRLILPSGLVVTAAGRPGYTGLTDGKWDAARFSDPWGIAVDTAGNVFVGDTLNYAIRRASVTPPPSISSILPTSGPASGGTVVTVSGSGFASGATVKFGASYTQWHSATNVSVTPTSITATTPAGSGIADVLVTNPDLQSATLASAFTYVSPPMITNISPNSGPAAGGTTVTISGLRFVSGLQLRFGNSSAAITSVTANTIVATTPAGPMSGGYVDVVVTNPDGQTGRWYSGFQYTPVPRMLTVQLAGSGTGTVSSSPAGIDCGSTCAASFGHGTAVTLTATPGASSTFSNWSGAGSGTPSRVITMDADKSVTATFAGPGPHGDVNGNGILEPADVFYLINHLFAGGPEEIGTSDMNGDGKVDVCDIFYLINHLFAGGPAPMSVSPPATQR